MAWRRSRSSRVPSRRFPRSASAPPRVSRVYQYYDVDVQLFPIPAPPLFFTTDIFGLVVSEDYTDDASVRKETATFLRCFGRVTYELLTVPNNAVGCEWACAIIKEGQEDLENTFTNDIFDLDVVTPANRKNNLTRLDLLWHSPVTGYIGGFEELAGGGGAQKPISLSTSQSDRSVWFDVRTKIKRKLQTDEGIWLVVSGLPNGEAELVGVHVKVDMTCFYYDYT